MITIRKPLCFTEIGRKDNQEDYLYPANANVDTRVFIMCDGMGGHDNGEVASMTAATALGDYLSSCTSVDIPAFEEGLAKAYDALDKIDTNSTRKPGTTMTCLCLNSDSYLVAHIGDSRIYHIRPSMYNAGTRRGGILYQSSDHSLVNDLLKAGELTEDEARDFPQKNIITRAMQPHLPKRCKADVYMFDDIQGGDYFFLCSDGVLERLSNEALCEILADKSTDDKQKLAAIKAICDRNTRDNYTCWLVPVDKADIKQGSNVSQVIQADAEISGKSQSAEKMILQANQVSSSQEDKGTSPVAKFFKNRVVRYAVFLLSVFLVVCTGYVIIKATHSTKNNHNNSIEKIIRRSTPNKSPLRSAAIVTEAELSSADKTNPDTTFQTESVVIAENSKLKIYYPKYSKIDLVCGEMPKKSDENVILTCAAAYTVKKLNSFSHSNIIGDHISNGKRYSGASSKTYRGAFVFYNGKAHFVYDDWSKEFKEAASKGGCGFAQDMMIHNGEIIDYCRKKTSSAEFRALCLIDGKVAVVDSKGVQKFGDFVDELSELGVTEAIYLDMGDWKHSWYRNSDGQAVDIYPKPNKYATNWITFYK